MSCIYTYMYIYIYVYTYVCMYIYIWNPRKALSPLPSVAQASAPNARNPLTATGRSLQGRSDPDRRQRPARRSAGLVFRFADCFPSSDGSWQSPVRRSQTASTPTPDHNPGHSVSLEKSVFAVKGFEFQRLRGGDLWGCGSKGLRGLKVKARKLEHMILIPDAITVRQRESSYESSLIHEALWFGRGRGGFGMELTWPT